MIGTLRLCAAAVLCVAAIGCGDSSDGDEPVGAQGGAAGSAGHAGTGGTAGKGGAGGSSGAAGKGGSAGAAGKGGAAGQGGGDAGPVCGDGAVGGSEACDDGNTAASDGCSADCEIEDGYTCTGAPSTCSAICGDGMLVGQEPCDDDNTTDGDGCSATCTVESGYHCTGAPSTCTTQCGDGTVAGAEACDDSNTTAGDGCSDTCVVENGYVCGSSPSVCTTVCGDSIVAGAETCDDGGTTPSDGCSDTCVVEAGYACAGAPSVCATVCGDGIPAGTEACDDGATAPSDGCSATCTVETGYQCAGAPSVCATVCGDGVQAGTEACDDGGTAPSDGCSATCTVETGFTCAGSPSICAPVCGDGTKVGLEACDDSNTTDGDCCSSACLIEAGCEVEDNSTIANANDFYPLSVNDRIKGFIRPSDDKDVFSFEVPAGMTGAITAQTLDGFVGTTCASNLVDSYITLYDAASTSLGTDDDGGAGYCSLFTKGALVPGTYYVEVKKADLASATMTFDYTLQLTLTLTECGDGVQETGEQCDDGNQNNGDGCSSTCMLESQVEAEPNGACATASGPFVPDVLMAGSVTPAGDVDYFALTLSAYSDLRLETFDANGPGTCASIDTVIQAFNASCTALGATDDEGGIGSCSLLDPTVASQAFMKHLAPGTYYVAVRGYSSVATFNYSLLATLVAKCGDGVVEGSEQCEGGANCQADCMFVPVCGDSTKGAGEQCDDGNTTNGDGCSSTCQLETTVEVEPNSACATATGPVTLTKSKYVTGAINPTGDNDYFAFSIATYADLRLETFDASGPGTCVSIDTLLQAFNSSCTALGAQDDESGIASCSLLDPTSSTQAFMRHLAPGTYYAVVKPYSTTATFSYMLQASLVAVCGNGVVEGSEQCDGGANCQADCMLVPVCGDGTKAASEQCEDGNTTNGDGCSATCTIEGTAEVEPNDTTAQADVAIPALTASTRLVGAVGTATDKDLFKVTVATQSVVRFEVFDSSLKDCVGMTATNLTLLSSTGTTLKTDTASSGIGSCPALVVNLDPGTYYIQAGASAAVPLYVLEVKFENDNGVETEPNEAQATSNAEAGMDFYVCADHQTGTDVDVYALTVPAGMSIRAEVVEVATTATGYETCESNGMDSHLTLYGPTYTSLTTDDDSGRGYCSLIDGTGSTPVKTAAHNLAAGTYYLAVRASSSSGASAVFNYCLAATIR